MKKEKKEKKAAVDLSTRNNGKFTKGNKEGNRFSSDNQPKNLKLKRAIKKEFQQVARQRLDELQDYATLKMSEWVIKKLENLDILSTHELEKIQKYIEFLRDCSGQKPSDKLEMTQKGLPQIVVRNDEVKKEIETLMKNANNYKDV